MSVMITMMRMSGAGHGQRENTLAFLCNCLYAAFTREELSSFFAEWDWPERSE